MTIVLPEWASNHFQVDENNELEIRLILDKEGRDFFQSKKDDMRCILSDNKNWANLPEEELKSEIQSYIICNLALGLIDKTNASIAKEQGRLKNGNDGTGRQHWIPECYLRSFAENGQIRKVKKDLISELALGKLEYAKKKKPGSLVGIGGVEFCESKSEAGKMYDPHYELFLAKLESDFALISKSSHSARSLWDFIVLSSFFLVLRVRTKEMRDSFHPSWMAKEALLLDVIPGVASHMEILSLHPKSIIPESVQKSIGKNISFPFTQHPIHTESADGDLSLWCIYTPDCLLWLRNKNSNVSKNNFVHYSRLSLVEIFENSKEASLYFRPSDPLWRVQKYNSID